MSREYELVIVTSNGWYPVLTACSPTTRLEVLDQLAWVVTEVRKGRFVDYDLVVCEVGQVGYTEESLEKIRAAKLPLK